jgi:hypothetical protein
MASAVQLGGAPASPLFVRYGQATIPNGQQLIRVVDADITANSVVVMSLGLTGGALSVQTGSAITLEPTVGFDCRISAVAVGAQLVSWAVLRY